MSDYTPIDCDIYERYELAIMHRETLRLRWRDTDGVTHVEMLTPTDLRAHEGVEFLHGMTPDGKKRVIRLDRIEGVLPRD